MSRMIAEANDTSSLVKRYRESSARVLSPDKTCIWKRNVQYTNIASFRETINKTYNLKLANYRDLHKWSVDCYENFWEEIWNYFVIVYSVPYTQVVKRGRCMIDTVWFPGAKFNYAENLLRFRDDHIAIRFVDEEYYEREECITFAQLYDEVKLYVAAFKENGLCAGDKVACYISNRKEAVFAMLATLALGGVWGGPRAVFGVNMTSLILNSIEPKFIFTCDKIKFAKREYDMLAKLRTIVEGLKTFPRVIIVLTDTSVPAPDISGIQNSCLLNDFLEKDMNRFLPDIPFVQVSANHPVFINYTSGTVSGIPKGLVQTARSLLPFLVCCGLHYNCSRSDVLLNYHSVDLGRWNRYLSTLALGSTIIIYLGNPRYSEKVSLWDVISKYEVTIFLIPPRSIDDLRRSGRLPGPHHNFDKLKMITMTNSTISIEHVEFFHKIFKNNVFIANVYGAAEIPSTLSGFDFNEEGYCAEIQAPALGLDLKVLDATGKEVVGEKGDVVITTPNPGLFSHLLNDENNETYKGLYYSKFPDLYCQNDIAWINPKTKGIVVTGRSDDVMMQHGYRSNSVDIYSAIQSIEDLEDYMCVPQDVEIGYQRIILFVKVRKGFEFNADLIQRIKKQVESVLSQDEVPAIVLETQSIPYNYRDKRMESLVRHIIATNQIPEIVNVENPSCLKIFCNIPELQHL